jgi:hypothetical protein
VVAWNATCKQPELAEKREKKELNMKKTYQKKRRSLETRGTRKGDMVFVRSDGKQVDFDFDAAPTDQSNGTPMECNRKTNHQIITLSLLHTDASIYAHTDPYKHT